MPSFKPHLLAKVKTGRKTHTRRLKKNGEKLITRPDGAKAVVDARGHIKWQTGRDYGCWPGRGLPSECRYDLHDLREEIVADISEEDARAEGFSGREEFLAAWDEINGKGKREAVVWVHVFKLKPETVARPTYDEFELFATGHA